MLQPREGGGPSGEGDILQRRPIYPRPPAASGGSAAEPAGTHPHPPDPPPWYTRGSVTRLNDEAKTRQRKGGLAWLHVTVMAFALLYLLTFGYVVLTVALLMIYGVDEW